MLSDPDSRSTYDLSQQIYWSSRATNRQNHAKPQPPRSNYSNNNQTAHSDAHKDTESTTAKPADPSSKDNKTHWSWRSTLFVIFLFWVVSSIFQSKPSNTTQLNSASHSEQTTPSKILLPSQESSGTTLHPSKQAPAPKPVVPETTKQSPPPESTIDCIGPDGKHLEERVTQKFCDDFNNAWKKSNAQQNNPGQSGCPPNSSKSYGTCICNDGYKMNYTTDQCDKIECPPNSTRAYTSCLCNSGYSMNYSTDQCDKLNCPQNSHESGNSCICNDGYIKNYSSGQCDRCPDNSTYSYGSCLCNDGYSKNYSSGQCEKLSCPSNSHISGNSCVCNDNYVKNYSNGQCEQCPENSTWSYGYCSCNGGYTKNYSTGKCDKP